jgi:hypothetical protein
MAPSEIALEEKPVRAGAKSAKQLATKSPIVTMAAAQAAARSKAADSPTAVRPLPPDMRREMSALAADENGPTSSIRKALEPKK